MTPAIAAALILSGVGTVRAQEADTNATTVAYWKFGGTAAVPENAATGVGILDLATNAGQGVLTGTAPVAASVENLWVLGPMAASPTFSNVVPPASLFNPNNYFNGGSASWDVGADEYAGPGGEMDCDNGAYGNEFDTPSFTEEVIFKTDYSNDPTLGTVKQTLVWNHQNSAFCHLQINESTAGNPADIGSLLFWSWNVQAFTTVRVTAAQNGGNRLDDGKWHYAAARYNNATLTMDLVVVNEDGTTAESSTFIGAPLNPGGSGSQGPLIIGNDEGAATPFDGLINQVRFSSAWLPVNQLLANAARCSAPAFVSSPATDLVVTGGALNLSAATWPAQMEGGPLELQWQLNGANLPGQTNLNLSLLPVTPANQGTYQLIASTACGGLAVTSAPVVLLVSNALPIVRWSFEDVVLPLNDAVPPAPIAQAGIVSSLTNWYNNYYPLITFNNAGYPGIGGNGTISLTNMVPPTSMFINGNNGGTNSFDASFIEVADGVVFYPNGSYPGDPFDFRTSFALELFFSSYGDQSAAGAMELICQGTDGGNTFCYGVNLNQAGPGALSFKINNHAIAPAGASFEDTNAGIQSVVLTNANYADGKWHYLLAQYDSSGNQISLSAANVDGTAARATQALPVGYSPLAAVSEGNLFIGRYRYPWTDDTRTFIGAIDEVQISEGLIRPDSGQLGFLPSVAVPQITRIAVSGGKVTITFTAGSQDVASAFTLMGSPVATGSYSALAAAVTSLGSGAFQATIAQTGPVEFYRIKR